METRAEHLKWCKERAILEYDFYPTLEEKHRNGLTSMMSDMNKHPDTGGEIVNSLVFMKLMGPPMNRQQFVNFINGFN